MRDDFASDRPLSEIIADLSRSPACTVTLGDLTDALGGRAIASLILLFGLACSLPLLPPGGTTIFGAPLLVLAPQLLLRAQGAWTPRRLRARQLSMSHLRRVFERMIPWLKRMEAVSRPRFGFLVGRIGQRVIGLICTVFAVVLILPIPLGNMLPAASVSFLSLALVQRDGAIALVGYALAAASVGVLVIAAHLVVELAHRAIQALPIS